MHCPMRGQLRLPKSWWKSLKKGNYTDQMTSNECSWDYHQLRDPPLTTSLILGWVTSNVPTPPNSNTFSDWRRACQVSWFKTLSPTPQTNNTHLDPGETTIWPFDPYVIRSCTLKPRQKCCNSRRVWEWCLKDNEQKGFSEHFNTKLRNKQKLIMTNDY